MAESLCYPPETITTLFIGYTAIQNKKFKKKKKVMSTQVLSGSDQNQILYFIRSTILIMNQTCLHLICWSQQTDTRNSFFKKKIKTLLCFFMSCFRVKTKLGGKARALMPPAPWFPLLTACTTVIHLLQLMNQCAQLLSCDSLQPHGL